MKVRVFEAGTGVGGTWYWNRYPGARFDSESYSYGYSFSQELLDEWHWTEHFSPQPETLKYLNHVADKFDLRRDIQFRSRVTAAHWQEDTRSWDDHAGGRQPAHLPLPDHRHRPAVGADHAEDRRHRELQGPVLPHRALAARAGELRRQARGGDRHRRHRRADHPGGRQDGRPSHRVPAHAQLVRAAAQRPDLQGGDGRDPRRAIRRSSSAASETFACFLHSPDPRKATRGDGRGARGALGEALRRTAASACGRATSATYWSTARPTRWSSDFVARKIRQRVKDQAVAEKLIPKNHGFGTRRVPLETKYYEVYNQPNVKLVDIKETPIERITPDRHQDQRRRRTRSTSSSTPPASTPSPAPSTASTSAASTG